MTETLRKPAIFSVDDPRLVIARAEEAQRSPVESITEAPADNLPAVLHHRPFRRPYLVDPVLRWLGVDIRNRPQKGTRGSANSIAHCAAQNVRVRAQSKLLRFPHVI